MLQDISDDRLEIKLDANGPIELSGLTDSFSALARQYNNVVVDRFWRDVEEKPKLYVSRLETGSILAELALGAVFLGHTITAMDYSIIVADFTARVSRMFKAFAGMESGKGDPRTVEDARDLQAFLKPIAGRSGASLKVRRAKFHRKDGVREVKVEYEFAEDEINRANAEAERVIAEGQAREKNSKNFKEVLFVWHQTNREAGKSTGRTGDRAIISDVVDRPLPVYFPQSIGDVKRKMTQSEKNPFSTGYIVDVNVQYVGGEPKIYYVIALHDAVPLD